MRISVIMPCHNAEQWIVHALRSVMQQTHPVHEIIVVNDDSSDSSMSQIAESGLPARILNVNVRNAAAARNAGIEVATGEWLALLDADDVWYPNHIARFMKLMRGSADAAFASNHDWISLDGSPIPMPEEFICRLPEPQSGLQVNDYFRIVKEGFHFGHSTVIYRRDRVLDVGMFDVTQKRRHDIDLWLRMIAGGTWTYDNEKGAGYREGTQGSISKALLECDYYYLRAMSKNLDRVDSPLFREHLAKHARRAMGIAFVDGSVEEYERLRQVAFPFLPLEFKFMYILGSACPGLLRHLIKAKRRVTQSGSLPSVEGHIGLGNAVAKDSGDTR